MCIETECSAGRHAYVSIFRVYLMSSLLNIWVS